MTKTKWLKIQQKSILNRIFFFFINDAKFIYEPYSHTSFIYLICSKSFIQSCSCWSDCLTLLLRLKQVTYALMKAEVGHLFFSATGNASRSRFCPSSSAHVFPQAFSRRLWVFLEVLWSGNCAYCSLKWGLISRSLQQLTNLRHIWHSGVWEILMTAHYVIRTKALLLIFKRSSVWWNFRKLSRDKFCSFVILKPYALLFIRQVLYTGTARLTAGVTHIRRTRKPVHLKMIQNLGLW